MLHIVKIYNTGLCVYESHGTDINKLSISVCSKLLGMDIKYLQVYVDNVYIRFKSSDISIIRKDMIKIMELNESPIPIDFGIDDLFEV